jgi:hypothetical protein
MKFMQIYDQLIVVGEKIPDERASEHAEIVNMVLNVFLASWEPFFKCIYAREIFLTLKFYGMTISRRRLRWSQRLERRAVTRTQPYLVRKIRAYVNYPKG